jgi:uncharacterized membrane protein
MMQFLTRTFLKGLAVVLPVAAAAYLVYWLAGDAERLIRRLLLSALPDQYYVPGLGLLLVVSMIFGVGLMMYPLLTRMILNGLDRLMRKVPLVNLIYGPVRDLMDMIGGDMTDTLGQVVMVTIPNTGLQAVGFVMQSDLSSLPEGFEKDDHVLVYLQMSYQIGGYCFVVPRDAVRPVDMSVQQAIRWVLMAGLTGGQAKATKLPSDASLSRDVNKT